MPASRSTVRWNEVTAVFGGAFDPPHLGHLRAAEGLLRNPGVKGILIVPMGASPQKLQMTRAEDRLTLSQLTFEPLIRQGAAQIDDLEIRRAQARPDRPTYTADTLDELRQRGGQWAFVIGTDQLLHLDRWHRFPELLGLSHWIILERQGLEQGQDTDAARRRLAEWETGGLIRRAGTEILWVRTEAPAISSTTIRESLAISGSAPTESLSPAVEAALKRLGLYGMKPPSV